MAEKGEGSKAMNAYIIVCFALAAVALLAFKWTNDHREQLAAEYRKHNQRIFDIQSGLYPNIRDYYTKVKEKKIFVVDKQVKDDTHLELKRIAQDKQFGLLLEESGDTKKDQLDVVQSGRGEEKFKEYYEYSCTVTLKNVTQSMWAAYLRAVLDPGRPENVLDDYLTVASIEAVRAVQQYGKVDVSLEGVGGRHADLSLWKVTIKFIWFTSKDEGDAA